SLTDAVPICPGRRPLKAIPGVAIEGNRVGFTPENMDSFETLDSDYKADRGCRGVGRLLWLKAFDRVAVSSAYENSDGELCGRRFRFSEDREVEQDGESEGLTEPGAVVRLDGFKESYQQAAAKTDRK